MEVLGQIPQYRLTVALEDGVRAIVGGADQVLAPDLFSIDVDSQCPAILIAIVVEVGSDHSIVAYHGANQNTKSAQCSIGRYDSGLVKVIVASAARGRTPRGLLWDGWEGKEYHLRLCGEWAGGRVAGGTDCIARQNAFLHHVHPQMGIYSHHWVGQAY